MDVDERYNRVFATQLEYLSDVDDELKEAIRLYTTSFYHDYNNSLRKGYLLTPQQRQVHDALAAVFDDIPPLIQAVTLYRGIRSYLDLKMMTRHHISTTLNLANALSFTTGSCCLLTISVPAGTRVFPLMTLSDEPGEYEVLLAPEATFVQVNKSRDAALKITVYDLTYIPVYSQVLSPSQPQQGQGQRQERLFNRLVNLFDPDESEMYDNIEDYLASLATTLGVSLTKSLQRRLIARFSPTKSI
jgi:hypothetical protein